jgi:phosphoesterase RecJ-like protein
LNEDFWQKVVTIIENNQTFVLTSHINPDGDALGSELALAEHLENLDKNVTIINSDPTPTIYRFLDERRKIHRFSPNKHTSVIARAEVIIVLDASGGWERLGPVGPALAESRAIKLCIDHHPDWHNFADLTIIDTDAAATAELIYSLIQAMNGSISKHIAEVLYAAILTDTGSFRFPKTSPQTHCVAADLLAAGADPLYLYRQIYEQSSLGQIRLKGYIMESIRTTAAGRIAYYTLSQEKLRKYRVRASDLDGIASLGQQIGNVRVSIFCTETAKGQVKISLRSDGTVAINQVAMEYGGGGHASAAGAIVPGTLNQVVNELVEKITALLARKEGQVVDET